MLETRATASRVVEALGRAFGRTARAALDLAYPPQCLACAEFVTEPGSLCASCWMGLRHLEGALCETCGEPFAVPVPAGTRCGACLESPPVYAEARAPLAYDDIVRDLVLALKRRDRQEGVRAYGAWMARAGRTLLAEADVLVPVPLHPRRLFARRFNQSALLARAVAAESGLPLLVDALKRHRATRSQMGLTPSQRARNVAGAFALAPARVAAIEARAVVLVDDVLTTGATVNECARVLLRAGAARVAVLTLARRTLAA